MTEPLAVELLKDLRAAVVRWERYRFSRIPVQPPNPHELHQHGLSHVDEQVRSRTKSDHLGRIERAGRSTVEVLHTDVLLVGFDHERKCPNPCLLCGRIQRSRGMVHCRYAPDTQKRQ